MKKRLTKVLAFILVTIIAVGTLTGCKNSKDDTEYDDYSYGLTENGYYDCYEEYKTELPDFESITITHDEILEWGMNQMNESNNVAFETVADYVYYYGEELLTTLGYAEKNVAEEGDKVEVSLEFYIDELLLDDFTSTRTYTATNDGDSIVSSFIGHSSSDEYEVEYVIDEDDEEFGGQTANVKVVINSVTMTNPIEAGMVEVNLEGIQEILPTVVDTETFLAALYPKLAESTLEMYLEEYVQEMDFEVPEVFINYEMYRFKYRLNKIGYTYDDYLEAASTTDEEVTTYCEKIARENFIAMLLLDSMEVEITEDDLDSYYSDTRENTEESQGIGYMKLSIMRDLSTEEIANRINFVESADSAEAE